jgi:hypothetical protein
MGGKLYFKEREVSKLSSIVNLGSSYFVSVSKLKFEIICFRCYSISFFVLLLLFIFTSSLLLTIFTLKIGN